MKKEQLLNDISRHGVDISNKSSNPACIEVLKEKYTRYIAGGYKKFNKSDDFSKSSYNKIDTPWGPIGNKKKRDL